ncbi:MAG: hypothetical protein Q8Q89_04010 [bacterium]|nr:hypothetical protein [bacterium]
MLWQIGNALFFYIVCPIFLFLFIVTIAVSIQMIFGKKAMDINELKVEIEREREKLKIPKNTKIKLIVGKLSLSDEYCVTWKIRLTNNFELFIGSDMDLASTKHEMYHIYRLVRQGSPAWTILRYIWEEFLAEVYAFTNLDITRLLTRN